MDRYETLDTNRSLDTKRVFSLKQIRLGEKFKDLKDKITNQEKSKLIKIDSEFQNIKYRIQALTQNVNDTKNNKKEILKFLVFNNKLFHNNEKESPSIKKHKKDNKLLYSHTEEIVRKLSSIDETFNKKKIKPIRFKNLKHKFIEDNLTSELNPGMERNLREINRTIKSSKLNMLIIDNKINSKANSKFNSRKSNLNVVYEHDNDYEIDNLLTTAHTDNKDLSMKYTIDESMSKTNVHNKLISNISIFEDNSKQLSNRYNPYPIDNYESIPSTSNLQTLNNASLKKKTFSYTEKMIDKLNIDLNLKSSMEYMKLKEQLVMSNSLSSTSRQNDHFIEISNENKLKALKEKQAKLQERCNLKFEELEKTNRRIEEIKAEKDATSALISKEKYKLEQVGKKSPIKENLIKGNKLKSIKVLVNLKEKEEDDMYQQTQHRIRINQLLDNEKYQAQEIKHALFIKESLKSDIVYLEEELKKCSSSIHKVINFLESYYHNILKKGEDTRKKGLSWILVAIWNLKCQIYMSYMPNYLDNELIEYFFLRSHKEIELQKSEKLLCELRELVRELRGREYTSYKKIKQKFTKPEITTSIIKFRHDNDKDNKNILSLNKGKSSIFSPINQIHDKKKLSASTSINIILPSIPIAKINVENDTEITFHNMNNFFNKKLTIKLDEKIQVLINYVEELEKITKEIDNELEIMKDKEIERITKEFMVNNYSRVYKVDIKTILSAIVGEKDLLSAMKTFINKKKKYLAVIDKTKI